jgi:hypothetical protein
MEGQKYKTKLQSVISCDFNNKKRVHLVGIIIVNSSCSLTERNKISHSYGTRNITVASILIICDF